MKIAFYLGKHGTFYDKVICLATFSKYSHCEIVFSDGMCASASCRDDGIRFKKIDLEEKWVVFDLLSQFDEAAIKYWFNLHDSDKYDYLGAFGSVLNIDSTSDSKKYCSYACATVLGIDPIITPGALYKKLIKEKMING